VPRAQHKAKPNLKAIRRGDARGLWVVSSPRDSFAFTPDLAICSVLQEYCDRRWAIGEFLAALPVFPAATSEFQDCDRMDMSSFRVYRRRSDKVLMQTSYLS
jgi:hypothetical protein